MVKIIFNNTEYTIEDNILASAETVFLSHLSTTMSGTGAVINFGEIVYNVDSVKLITAMNSFISHLRTISGNDSSIVVNGTEYVVDSTKIASAISELENTLIKLESDGESSGLINFADDGEGNITITISSGLINFADDGEGNITITTSSGLINFADDGEGNITMEVV